jgi:hypothetical protein
MRGATQQRLCVVLNLLAGGPLRAVVGGIGCALAAVVFLLRADTGSGIGFAVLSAWCVVGYLIAKRCRRILNREERDRS